MSLEKEEQNFRWENLNEEEKYCVKGFYKSSQKIKTLCPENKGKITSRLIKEAFDTTWGEHNITEGDNEDKNTAEKYVIKEYTQTCYACPSQWECVTDDGRDIYIRYRWGNLNIYINAFTDKEELIFHDSIGGGLDGLLSTEKLMKITSEVLDWSEAVEDKEDIL